MKRKILIITAALFGATVAGYAQSGLEAQWTSPVSSAAAQPATGPSVPVPFTPGRGPAPSAPATITSTTHVSITLDLKVHGNSLTGTVLQGGEIVPLTIE